MAPRGAICTSPDQINRELHHRVITASSLANRGANLPAPTPMKVAGEKQPTPQRTHHAVNSQRSMVAAKLANMTQGQRTDIEPSANLQNVSQADAAEMLNVSTRTVAAAAKVTAGRRQRINHHPARPLRRVGRFWGGNPLRRLRNAYANPRNNKAQQDGLG